MRTILFITALFMSTLLSAQKPVEIPLWPNGAPNTNGLTGDQPMMAAAVLFCATQRMALPGLVFCR